MARADWWQPVDTRVGDDFRVRHKRKGRNEMIADWHFPNWDCPGCLQWSAYSENNTTNAQNSPLATEEGSK